MSSIIKSQPHKRTSVAGAHANQATRPRHDEGCTIVRHTQLSDKIRKNRRSILSSKFVFGLVSVAVSLVCLLAFEKGLRAKLEPLETTTHIRIDGKDFGTIDKINGLSDLQISKQHPSEEFTRVSLNRDLVTEPSLYLWAKQTFEKRDKLKNIELVVKSKSGRVVSEFVLIKSKPLHWTLEATEPAVGGFHERVEFAVQEIAIR